MKERENLVKVGGKDNSAYLNACFFCLDRRGVAILRGLGNRQAKVLEIKAEILSLDSVEEEYTKKVEVNDTAGLEVKLIRIGGGNES